MSELKDRFPTTSVSGFEGGMHLVWELDSELPSARKLQASSRNLGVGIYNIAESPAYQVEPRAEHNHLVLLGYACLDTQKIARGVERLARAALEGTRSALTGALCDRF
jgi:GntR family transcriptional regulator/MocR family aminotransferase